MTHLSVNFEKLFQIPCSHGIIPCFHSLFFLISCMALLSVNLDVIRIYLPTVPFLVYRNYRNEGRGAHLIFYLLEGALIKENAK